MNAIVRQVTPGKTAKLVNKVFVFCSFVVCLDALFALFYKLHMQKKPT